MRIGELESRSGLSRHTLRYYEARGLLGNIRRSGNNYRDYPEALVKQLELLQKMQALGFSLDEIQQVLNGLRSRNIDCVDGARLMAEKRSRVEEQITGLKAVSRILKKEQQRLEDNARRHGRITQ